MLGAAKDTQEHYPTSEDNREEPKGRIGVKPTLRFVQDLWEAHEVTGSWIISEMFTVKKLSKTISIP